MTASQVVLDTNMLVAAAYPPSPTSTKFGSQDRDMNAVAGYAGLRVVRPSGARGHLAGARRIASVAPAGRMAGGRAAGLPGLAVGPGRAVPISHRGDAAAGDPWLKDG